MIKVDEKDPEVRALRAEESKLQTLLSDRAAEESELSRTTQIYLSRRKSNERARLEAEADELLRGTAMKANPDDDLKDIELIEHRISVLDIAIDKQRMELDKARSRFSLKVCEANRARYVEIEKRIAKALAELGSANESEVLFSRELQDAGCNSIPFRPMCVGVIGLPSDDQSVAAFHMRELREYCPEACA